MSTPAISVVMPVYNGEKYLREAIDSILNQTFSNFEFIILNDGSTDKTEEIILSYTDPRIVYVKNEENLQIVKTLNKGIALAKGKYIARMDADDISMPERFAKQFAFMEANPDVGVCGTWLKTFGEISDVLQMPVSHDEILVTLLFNSCIMHPTVFMRKTVLCAQTVIYDENYNKAEDYELWTRLIFKTKFANIPQALLNYRILDTSNNRSHYKKTQQCLADQIREKYLLAFGFVPDDVELNLHNRISSSEHEFSKDEMFSISKWLIYLNSVVSKNQWFLDKKIAKTIIVKKAYAVFSLLQKKQPYFSEKYLIYKCFSSISGFDFVFLRSKIFFKIFK